MSVVIEMLFVPLSVNSIRQVTEREKNNTHTQKKTKKLHYSSSFFIFLFLCTLPFINDIGIYSVNLRLLCAVIFCVAYFFHFDTLLAPLELHCDHLKCCVFKMSIRTPKPIEYERTRSHSQRKQYIHTNTHTYNIRKFYPTYTLNNCTFELELFIIQSAVNRKTRPSIQKENRDLHIKERTNKTTTTKTTPTHIHV